MQLTGQQLRSTTDAGRRFGLQLVNIGRSVAGFLGALNPLRGGLVNVGAQLMQGLIRGVQRMGPAVERAIAGMASKIVTWFKARLGIHSPSTVFAVIGDNTLAGYAVGLKRSSEAPIRHLRTLSGMAAVALAASSLPLPAAAGSLIIFAAQQQAHAIERLQRFEDGPRRQAPLASPPLVSKEVHHHHSYRMSFHIDGGKHDARQIAREIERLRRGALNSALHDGGDDL